MKLTIRQYAWIVPVAVLSGCASMHAEKNASVPAPLQAAPNETLSLQVSASGVQIYECKVSQDNPGRYEWALKAPEADLFDGKGTKIGKHYGGPTWEAFDGSKAVGEVKARDPGPDANAIPWLLLTAKNTSGKGLMARVKSIQRVETIGGKAPADGCDASRSGKEVRIGYKAIYNFYTSKA